MGVASKWTPGKHVSELFSDKIQLWVQIHNLPVEYRGKQFAIRFAEKAGKVIQSSKGNEGKAGMDDIRKYIKYKVEVDLHKPVVPGWTLDRGTKSPVWIEFKYERLSNICFSCEKIEHETRL